MNYRIFTSVKLAETEGRGTSILSVLYPFYNFLLISLTLSGTVWIETPSKGSIMNDLSSFNFLISEPSCVVDLYMWSRIILYELEIT